MAVFNGGASGPGTGVGLKADTGRALAEALAFADQHDGVTLIECTLARDDCTSELLLWGSNVATSNGRKC